MAIPLDTSMLGLHVLAQHGGLCSWSDLMREKDHDFVCIVTG